jgi:hypothetical protein
MKTANLRGNYNLRFIWQIGSMVFLGCMPLLELRGEIDVELQFSPTCFHLSLQVNFTNILSTTATFPQPKSTNIKCNQRNTDWLTLTQLLQTKSCL